MADGWSGRGAYAARKVGVGAADAGRVVPDDDGGEDGGGGDEAGGVGEGGRATRGSRRERCVSSRIPSVTAR